MYVLVNNLTIIWNVNANSGDVAQSFNLVNNLTIIWNVNKENITISEISYLLII